ncbi:MAG: TonB-dependent receptor [Woeseiaceae bacterium]|nr:TonB-dependent receptor [Woeseiaceae bacterium]
MKLAHLFNSLRDSRFIGKALLGAAATGLVVFSLPATTLAQEGAAGALLEEIVTTARKRSQAEKAQDVPVAVNAFGAAQIEALFVQKLDDLSYLMPNVQLEAVGTFPGVQNFSIRGQGINSSIPSVDPTVGVFVDGIYMGTTYGVVVDTFDLESLEILRGPQGLLFGRNVTGGAVLLRNARPDGEFGFKVRVGADDEERTNIAAAIQDGTDTFAAKLVVYRDDDSGYFTNNNQSVPTDPATATFPAPHPLQPFYVNPATRSQVGEMKTTIVRPTFVFTPNDSVDVTFIWENGESEGDGAVWTNVTAQRAGAEADFTTTADEIGFTEMEWNNGVLEVNVDAWNGTITNLFGYREVEADSAADIDGRFLPIFAAPGFTDQDQISNELRWSGNFSDGWAATIGLYYFDMDVEYREARYIWLPPPLGPAPAGINLQRALGGDMQADNIGIFWNNDFYLNDTWTFNLGVRYTDESKSAQIITGTCTDNTNFSCTFNSFSGDWQNVTPKVGIQASLGDSSLFYAHYSQGIRSGGFNFRNAKPLVIPPGPTEEEKTNMFEVGLKTDFADGRARLNVAAFHNDVSDMQRELNLPDPDVIVLQGTINAGDVEIQGIEADFVWLPLDNLSLTASLGIQDSEYTSVNPLVGAIETALGQTVLGPDLPRLAPSNYSFGFSWDIPLGNAGLVNIAANHAYRESHPYNDSNSEVFSDQRRTNASLNWYSPSEMWQVSVYGKNLSDEANWGNLTSIAGLWTAGPMQKGRQVGVEVHFRME